MKTRVRDLDFDHSVAVYGAGGGSPAVLMRAQTAPSAESFTTFAVLDSDVQGWSAGYYYVRSMAAAEWKGSPWSSVLVYAVDGDTPITAVKRLPGDKRFQPLGEFEAVETIERAVAEHDAYRASAEPASRVRPRLWASAGTGPVFPVSIGNSALLGLPDLVMLGDGPGVAAGTSFALVPFDEAHPTPSPDGPPVIVDVYALTGSDPERVRRDILSGRRRPAMRLTVGSRRDIAGEE
jgi:hypothetical protein